LRQTFYSGEFLSQSEFSTTYAFVHNNIVVDDYDNDMSPLTSSKIK
jgi:hypothetical protein